MAKRLSKDHPLYHKFVALEEKMNELGITVFAYNNIYLKDNATGLEVGIYSADGEGEQSVPTIFDGTQLVYGD